VTSISSSGHNRGSREKSPGQGSRIKGLKSSYPVLNSPYLPYFFLALLTIVFFWKILTPFPLSRSWLWEDFLQQNYPYRVFAAVSLSLRKFPFWNPYVFAGQPFFADIQTAVLYPFNLLQALFVHGDTLDPFIVELTEILHYFLAAYFTFRFLRLSSLNIESSLFGAVTFAFSGFMVTHAIHTNFVNVFIWLPLILETFERALSSGKFRYALLSAVFLALSNMGGYPQYSLYIYYTLALYWLIFELDLWKTAGFKLAGASGRILLLAFVTAAALGLNAFNYIPAAELADYTPRSSMSYEASVEHSINPLFILKLISPGFFGVQYPDHNTYWAGLYSAFWETCLFVGVLPLILALRAFKAFKVNRHVRFAAMLALVSLWLGLGRYGLLYKIFFLFAPGFDRFRIPGRFSALFSFALALLAAHGLSLLVKKREKVRGDYFRSTVFILPTMFFILSLFSLFLLGTSFWDGVASGFTAGKAFKDIAKGAGLESLAWIGAAGFFLAACVKTSRIGERSLAYLAIFFAFAELYVFGAPFLRGTVRPQELYAESELVREFQKEGEKELFRINSRSLDYPGVLLLQRNQGSIHHLFLIEGYNPLQLKRRLGEINVERRFDLLNVKYKVAVDLKQRTAGFTLHPTYLPRAFMVHRWKVIEEEQKVLSTLNSPEFDYRSEIIVEKKPGIDSVASGAHIESKVEITSYDGNEIKIRTSSPEPGVLVLSEWYYPAWKVWVDGREGEVFRADHALRAVALQGGNHEVRFAYSSETCRKGMAASIITAIFMLAISLVLRLRGRF
jgi:hypothetical protein